MILEHWALPWKGVVERSVAAGGWQEGPNRPL